MKNYIIAGWNCTVSGDEIVVGDNYAPFASEVAADKDTLLFELSVKCDTLLENCELGDLVDSYPDESVRIEMHRLDDKWQMVSFQPNKTKPFSLLEATLDYSSVKLYIYDTTLIDFAFNNAMMMTYACASALRGDTLLFHSSVVVKEDKAYLFLGKSGTGKSTHTALWLKHIVGSHRLNDDNPVVRILPDGARVYGSPWSGKTPCYINQSYPIGGIVRLWQAPQNHIDRLRPSAAFAAILPTVSTLPCSNAITTGVRDAITKVVEQVPIYRLECLPDEAAAQLSYSTITS